MTKKTIVSSTVRQKPRRRKKARPGEIIAAGLVEFSNNGYAATRLEDVAKRAGIVKGTIYRYFKDKEALFLATVLSHAKPTFDHMEEIISEFDGPTKALLIKVINIVHNNLVNGDMHILFRIVISEGTKFPQLAQLYHREGIAKGQLILSKILKRGIDRGEIRADATAGLPMLIMAPALMAAVWKMLFDQKQPINAEQFISGHIDLVLNGLLVQNQNRTGY